MAEVKNVSVEVKMTEDYKQARRDYDAALNRLQELLNAGKAFEAVGIRTVKFIVRSIYGDAPEEHMYLNVSTSKLEQVVTAINSSWGETYATRFNAREEAKKYCVPGYEIVEVDG
ncbi:hypothetical protein H9L19_06325 [Weissella diestrammenae]|uniref:Uncharacterized protein n=1 Tax=Weissella diestrammenae TaxID=1162633 RepID=A0A7G9T4H3_9LACO|nr:hypothetical protein [Weissella diestrammenae]MCM0582132.1 hypothetical protein [Weissella diestrammenae]QNN74998.1 hypothetical protein H9L19_06325 [Weissella diestrammenae]